jgi:4-amino-4-deoxy-L-arabinose transferase-like glycosyltransferase
VALLSSLVAVGGAIRLRDLTSVPSWTDEVREVLIGLDIASGRALPLVGTRAYLGAMWNYLLAASFLSFGFEPEVPRLVALVFGLCTIIATYLLGRRLGGRLAGAIAAGLLTVSGTHVLVSSRIAWSHNLTPLFTTLAIWLLLGTGPRGGPSLALAGLACGLAVQTHITAVAVVAAVGAFVLGWRRPWLTSRWAWLGAAAFLAAYANVLLFYLGSGPGVLAGDGRASYGRGTVIDLISSYARGETTPVGLVLINVGRTALAFTRILSGAIDIRPTVGAYLGDLLVIATIVLFLVGLLWFTRRASALPLLVLAAYGLILVCANTETEVIPNGRLLMPVIPLSLALVSCGIIQIVRWPARRELARGAIATTLAGLLAFASLGHLEARLGDMQDSSYDSGNLSAVVDAVASARGPTEAVFLDPLLEKLWLDGGGTYRMALRYRFRLAGIPVGELRERDDSQRPALDGCDINRAVVERLTIGEGDPRERQLPGSGATSPGAVVWVVRPAAPREAVRGAVLAVRNRPPIAASGRARQFCDPGRLI